MTMKPYVSIDIDFAKVRFLLPVDGPVVVNGAEDRIVVYVVRELGDEAELEAILVAQTVDVEIKAVGA